MVTASHTPLIAHAATSTTHPHAYHELFESHVLPFWQQNPPRHRLSKKPYKSIWDRNSVLQEDSLTFQVQPSLTSCSPTRQRLIWFATQKQKVAPQQERTFFPHTLPVRSRRRGA